MNLSDAIQRYLKDREVKGVAASSIRNDRHTLQLFLADVGNVQTQNLRPQHLDLFWSRRTTWGPGTMNRGRANLSSFFKWCQVRGHLSRTTDLMEGYRKIRVPPRNRIIIPQPEFTSFLDGITSPRSRIACAIGLYLFARISETRGLRWQDLNLTAIDPLTGDLAPRAEVFRDKTRTLDTLPLCTELHRELKRWALVYAAEMGEPVQPGWYVVPKIQPGTRTGVKGQKGVFATLTPAEMLPMEKAHLTHSIAKVLKDAGYYQKYEGGHTLRRSGATALYDQLSSIGHDRAIRVCQAMLGHSSIQTTEIYLRLDLDRKVRNELLAGKPMFPEQEVAGVVDLYTRTEHTRALREQA